MNESGHYLKRMYHYDPGWLIKLIPKDFSYKGNYKPVRFKEITKALQDPSDKIV